MQCTGGGWTAAAAHACPPLPAPSACQRAPVSRPAPAPRCTSASTHHVDQLLRQRLRRRRVERDGRHLVVLCAPQAHGAAPHAKRGRQRQAGGRRGVHRCQHCSSLCGFSGRTNVCLVAGVALQRRRRQRRRRRRYGLGSGQSWRVKQLERWQPHRKDRGPRLSRRLGSDRRPVELTLEHSQRYRPPSIGRCRHRAIKHALGAAATNSSRVWCVLLEAWQGVGSLGVGCSDAQNVRSRIALHSLLPAAGSGCCARCVGGGGGEGRPLDHLPAGSVAATLQECFFYIHGLYRARQ